MQIKTILYKNIKYNLLIKKLKQKKFLLQNLNWKKNIKQ